MIPQVLLEIRSIQRLAILSDRSLMSVGRILGIPFEIMGLLRNEQGPVPSLLVTDLNKVIIFSMHGHYATYALFWLFIKREPNLYHGPYAKIFEESLLFSLIRIVTG